MWHLLLLLLLLLILLLDWAATTDLVVISVSIINVFLKPTILLLILRLMSLSLRYGVAHLLISLLRRLSIHITLLAHLLHLRVMVVLLWLLGNNHIRIVLLIHICCVVVLISVHLLVLMEAGWMVLLRWSQSISKHHCIVLCAIRLSLHLFNYNIQKQQQIYL